MLKDTKDKYRYFVIWQIPLFCNSEWYKGLIPLFCNDTTILYFYVELLLLHLLMKIPSLVSKEARGRRCLCKNSELLILKSYGKKGCGDMIRYRYFVILMVSKYATPWPHNIVIALSYRTPSRSGVGILPPLPLIRIL